MVAPYESDSQIAKLVNLKVADFAISEDSDLVVYGVKVLLKMNNEGDCDFIDLSLWKSQDVSNIYLKKYLELDFLGRMDAAILSGSDYNKSVKGIGIKKAVKHIYNHKSLNAAIQYLRNDKTFKEHVAEDYEQTVLESKLIFCLATTYNRFQNKL
jgi:exonuclease-1